MTDRLTPEAQAALAGSSWPQDAPQAPTSTAGGTNGTPDPRDMEIARLRNLLTKVAEHPDTHPLIASVIRNELSH